MINRNGKGYRDDTASVAIRNEQKKKITDLRNACIKVLKVIAKQFGFKITSIYLVYVEE